MRYLLYGYYGYGNFGDDLLLRAVVEGISRRDPKASFDVHGLMPVSGCADSVRFPGIARYLQGIRRRPWNIFFYLIALARLLEKVDVFVIGGGTLFIDKGRFNSSLALLYVATLYARLRHRRVVIIGVSADRLTHPISLWLTRRILGSAEFVTMRDEPSLSYANLVVPERLYLSSDLVFSLDLGIPSARQASRAPVIGLCFIDYYRTVEFSESRHAAYRQAITDLIERYCDIWNIAVITFQRGIGQRDDWLVEALAERFSNIPVFHVATLEDAQRMAASVDIFVTTRFHLGILGAIWGKSVVVIDHELKMATLASDFSFPSVGLGDFIDRSIDLEALLKLCDPVKTREKCDIERQRGEINFSWL
jgi:polysaccharide pyruvyl transferase WcaK-like protein